MRRNGGLDRALGLVEEAVRRFEDESGAALAPIFYLSVGAPGAARPGGHPSVRLEWLSEASQFGRAARALEPLRTALKQRREIRGIVLVECQEDFDGTRCRGESWDLEFERGFSELPAASPEISASPARRFDWTGLECQTS